MKYTCRDCGKETGISYMGRCGRCYDRYWDEKEGKPTKRKKALK